MYGAGPHFSSRYGTARGLPATSSPPGPRRWAERPSESLPCCAHTPWPLLIADAGGTEQSSEKPFRELEVARFLIQVPLNGKTPVRVWFLLLLLHWRSGLARPP